MDTTPAEPTTEVPGVIAEAAAVVKDRIKTISEDALRAASVCACRECRTHATGIYEWATGMLNRTAPIEP